MQAFNFQLRDSVATSTDDSRSRYVPSSIYSGPGPVEESATPVQHSFHHSDFNEPPRFRESQAPVHQSPARTTRPRASAALNMNDPIAMHLLMETAITDSRDCNILSFEELEGLKREKAFLRTRIDGTRRQLALETKMRDAAQSLNRLYTSRRNSNDLRPGTLDPHNKPKRRSFLGSLGVQHEALGKADDEYEASNRQIEKLGQELSAMEGRLVEVERAILNHTAGILQMTHRGLKKNLRKNELPRSPESMASQSHRSVSNSDPIEEFDERSLYHVPAYVHELHAPSNPAPVRKLDRDTQAIGDVASRLLQLSTRLHGMVLEVHPVEHFESPPQPTDENIAGRIGAQIQAQLRYMSQGLEAMATAQVRNSTGQQRDLESREQCQAVNSKLRQILQRTDTVGHSPQIPQEEPTGSDLQSQLLHSDSMLDRLNARVETLIEQKEILTRQIQQQRELNSKSDAQRDAQIRDLTEELAEAKQLQSMSEQEVHQSEEQITLLMDQLDRLQSDEALFQQQRGLEESKALRAERDARKQSEEKFQANLQAHQMTHAQLQADYAKVQNDFELRSQSHIQQMNELTQAREQAEMEIKKYQAEANHLFGQIASVQADHAQDSTRMQGELQDRESQLAQMQTELTLVKAELDGAYGTRAQRAADVSSNPAIQKEIDALNARNKELEEHLEHLAQEHATKGAGSAEMQNKVNALQKELKETIEDYEVMTKASIDFEKERDQMEATIDGMRDRCEVLETQLNEEKLRWLGAKDNVLGETTSTTVLKNEFKKMMRDSRSESQKAIRVEHEERKRLETELRRLKRDLGMSISSKSLQMPSQSNTRAASATPA